ncbi:lipopolysaccharide heptosyltransferase II [Desulfoferrobacter suflitae]|uniref:lipopolysaccharide heptosyltransferase II n=1 Tax=Desulfoferrobacter suflitae TaxID=2865782 RepID=UPI0021640939|nr:lipopolysaccharide heptosyltransferase II [Desulfoferrobacter suflitae]MCK8603850.1 lipopolysaccharide heptosyltransferase II [Desulfoferrobacter suflitae]
MNSHETGKILIRSTNWLGDAVMTTPAMGVVRATFPGAEITVVANPAVAMLFEGHPYCDRIVVWDKSKVHRGITGLLRFTKTLREQHYDLAILFQNAMEAAVMARLAGIPRRLGYRSDGRAWLLTDGVPVGRREKRLHHVDYYLQLLKKNGMTARPGDLTLCCTPEETAAARKELGDVDWIAVHPGASYGSAKRWLPERFAQSANKIYQEFRTPILLLGSPEDASTGKRIAEQLKVPHKSLIGRTSIRQLMAVLSQCRLLLTNDSGPMHIAAAFRVPLVALFGPTDHTTTSPPGNMSIILRHEVDCAPCLKRRCPSDHRCMTAIGVEEVIVAVRTLLDSTA